PRQLLSGRGIGSVVVWAVAFGLSTALAPRLGHHGVIPRRPRQSPAFGKPTRALWIPIAAPSLLILGAVYAGEPLGPAGLFAAVALILVLPRTRVLANAGVWMLACVAVLIAMEHRRQQAPWSAVAVVFIWVIARWASHPNALGVMRRFRP